MAEFVLKTDKAKECYDFIKDLERKKINDSGEILALYDDIIRLEPDYAPAYVKRAALRTNLKMFAEAERDLSCAIELGYISAEVYYTRSFCYAAFGNRTEERLADLHAALKLDPRHAKANGELGQYMYECGIEQDAFRLFSEAIDSKSSDPLVFMLRGMINKKKKRFEHALVDFLDSRKCNARNTVLYSLMAECYYELGAYERALKNYDTAAFADPHSPEPHYKMGQICHELNDFAAAIKHFDRLILLLKDPEVGYFSRGIACLDKGDPAAAAHDFEKTLELNPANAVAAHLLSEACRALSDESAAQKYAALARELGFEEQASE